MPNMRKRSALYEQSAAEIRERRLRQLPVPVSGDVWRTDHWQDRTAGDIWAEIKHEPLAQLIRELKDHGMLDEPGTWKPRLFKE